MGVIFGSLHDAMVYSCSPATLQFSSLNLDFHLLVWATNQNLREKHAEGSLKQINNKTWVPIKMLQTMIKIEMGFSAP